jgi:hypothetical protein
MNELQQRLAQPFEPKYIEWKPGASKGDKCMAMPYADMRAYMDRLDELFGMEWSVRYVAWGETRIMCELTINGVTRTSTGESDAQDAKNGLAGTVAEAQAFKRAAAMFGLGRYLYDLPSAWVAYDSQYKRISDQGKAELESRYKQWYARQTSQKPTPIVTVDNPFDDVPAKPEVATPEQLQELETLGAKFYGDEWREQRTKLAQAISKGEVSELHYLLPKEATKLIEGIKKKMAEVNGKVTV